MSEPVLTARGVTKAFGKQRALDHVSIGVTEGEFLGLLGPNGAGKTTLLLVACGLLIPDSGEIELFGRSYAKQRAEILRRLGVVFQARAVDLEISVRAALRFHGALFGLSGSALDRRIEETADALAIADLLDRRAATLSGGNLRRVEIARALLNRPRLLLMDEPSTGLDPMIRANLLGYLQELCKSEGLAVIWATHLLDEVADADHIAVMHNGRLEHLLPPDRRPATLLSAYEQMAPVEASPELGLVS